jgi:hypothetical protein
MHRNALHPLAARVELIKRFTPRASVMYRFTSSTLCLLLVPSIYCFSTSHVLDCRVPLATQRLSSPSPSPPSAPLTPRGFLGLTVCRHLRVCLFSLSVRDSCLFILPCPSCLSLPAPFAPPPHHHLHHPCSSCAPSPSPPPCLASSSPRLHLCAPRRSW